MFQTAECSRAPGLLQRMERRKYRYDRGLANLTERVRVLRCFRRRSGVERCGMLRVFLRMERGAVCSSDPSRKYEYTFIACFYMFKAFFAKVEYILV